MKHPTAALVLLSLAMGVAAPSAGMAADCSQQGTLARPIALGVSGGNINDIKILKKKNLEECFGGTLGAMVQDKQLKQFILSNNHVLARENRARRDELIVQPALPDVGCQKSPGDAVATFRRAVPIRFGGPVNVVDAALAAVNPADVSADILNIGGIAATIATPMVGMGVQKMGRTTCLTTGRISAVGVALKVVYPTGIATFQNQIKIGPQDFSEPGDSGSLIVTGDSCPRAVGLLFAGSKNNRATFANPIGVVLRQLGGGLRFVAGCTAPAAAGAAEVAGPQPGEASVSAAAVEAASAVRDRHREQLMRIPGAVGTGIGVGNRTGQAAIEVYVKKLTPQVESAAPAEVDGVPVKLIETGDIVPY